jgi:hypothetical protein
LLESSRRVFEHDGRLPLIWGNSQQHAALTVHQLMFAQARDVAGERGHTPRFAAAAANHEGGLLDTLPRLSLAAREFSE